MPIKWIIIANAIKQTHAHTLKLDKPIFFSQQIKHEACYRRGKSKRQIPALAESNIHCEQVWIIAGFADQALATVL